MFCAYRLTVSPDPGGCEPKRSRQFTPQLRWGAVRQSPPVTLYCFDVLGRATGRVSSLEMGQNLEPRGAGGKDSERSSRREILTSPSRDVHTVPSRGREPRTGPTRSGRAEGPCACGPVDRTRTPRTLRPSRGAIPVPCQAGTRAGTRGVRPCRGPPDVQCTRKRPPGEVCGEGMGKDLSCVRATDGLLFPLSSSAVVPIPTPSRRAGPRRP